MNAALHARAFELDATPRDLACTLLMAVVGRRVGVFAQVGDGAIVVDDGTSDGYRVAFWPQSGEYANSTYFVTESEALQHLEVVFDRDRAILDVALFTDGLQSLALKYDIRGVHAPFFRPMFARVREESAGLVTRLTEPVSSFLNSPQVNGRTDDDKTLVLATRRPVVVETSS